MSEDHRGFRLGVLLYAFGPKGELLLIKRTKQPNKGLWCAAGGKLEMATGESPYECAVREAKEEIGIDLSASDLDLRCVISEKNYEDTGHWLMFVFILRVTIDALPAAIDEGEFGMFDRSELANLSMPAFDRQVMQECILNTEGPLLSVLSVDGLAEPIERSLVVEQEIASRR